MLNTSTALTQTDLALMLADIVCTNDRPPLWHEGAAIITNGHVGFLIENVDQPVDWFLWDGDRWATPEKESTLRSTPAELMAAFAYKGEPADFELPVVEPHRSWANPREVIETTCDECEGTGEVECNYGHDHECEDCDGTGKVKDTRIDVEYHSNLRAKDRAILTQAGHIEKRYLWMISRLAEHRQLSCKVLGGTMIGLSLSFDGGVGLVMGIISRD